MFGKHAQVAKIGPLQFEHHLPSANIPRGGHFAAGCPNALIAAGSFVPGVGLAPRRGVGEFCPCTGRPRPVEHKGAEPLQFASGAEVEKLILGG